ncbi:hypothetical protein GA0116948_102229 [Chitinophaga costaii]|uniref:YggT family protein n=1 Tax=Chitinophaga costaii TaxID=1335309 RepID=A0A1C4AQ27_9BACT|nr:hypothetical protein [Chitinophaga costaii]PUZ26695.1 hypothetical protein DCM91_09830 [Chitinophaga costaii]SCB96586.1 hypothetical protein GA0116948_102229 [Chitinophaga costaii]
MIAQIFFLAINFFIVALFLYSKLLPYKDRLTGNYAGLFNFVNKVFTPIINFLKGIFKPAQVGTGLAVDTAQLALLIILLVLLNVFHYF